MAIVVAGQSNAEGLAPRLAALLGVEAIDAAHGGTNLVPYVGESSWLNTDNPLMKKLASNVVGKEISHIWWIQGENDAQYVDITEADYTKALKRLYGLFCVATKNLPDFWVSPIAGWHSNYKNLRAILAAQYRIVGSIVYINSGPEYYDLPNDGTHLTDEGRQLFAERFAALVKGRL